MSKVTLKTQCIPEVQFIMAAMERHHLLAQSSASFTDRFGTDGAALLEFTAKVTHRATGREFVVGREALRKFQIIAGFIVDARADKADWDVGDLADHLQATFLDFVFVEGVEDATTVIEPWIEEATSFVCSRHRRYVHYIPCVALQIGVHKSYGFGSIKFTQKSSFFEEFSPSITRYESARSRLSERARRNAAPAMQWCWKDRENAPAKTPEERFKEFTKATDWIAQVSVRRCARRVSETRAESALRIAMSAMTLLLEGTEGAGLRLVDDPFVPHQTSKLSSQGNGFVRPSSSWRFGGPKAEDGWQEHLESAAKPILSTIHSLIEKTLAGESLSYGDQIAIRSITWYADAIRDANIETRMIKCATAVECIVLPDRFDTTATFVIRGSLLAQRQGLPMIHYAAIAKRLYERRSDVAHGNLDSLNASQGESTRDALEFSRNAILQFLMFCALPQIDGSARTGTRQDFINLYQQLEGSQHSEVKEIVTKFRFKSWKIVPAYNP